MTVSSRSGIALVFVPTTAGVDQLTIDLRKKFGSATVVRMHSGSTMSGAERDEAARRLFAVSEQSAPLVVVATEV